MKIFLVIGVFSNRKLFTMYSWSIIWTFTLAICTWHLKNASAGISVRLASTYLVNSKKPVNTVSERFLSFTLQPEVLSHVVECKEWNVSLNLIRPLLPAYLRLAGPVTNTLIFQRMQNSKPVADFAIKSTSFIVTGSQWHKVMEIANKTGFNVIAALNAGIHNKNNNIDLTNALEFINFSNENNFNMDWQLGFEVQKIANDDGRITGQDVSILRKVLEVFPRYQRSLILGPDMTNFENRADIAFVRNYLAEAQNALNVFTLHPDFSNVKEGDDEYELLFQLFTKMDKYLWVREGILKSHSNGVVPRKSIWIAESESKDQICRFSDTITYVKRIGAAAKLGASVYLRNPHLLSLFEPTPEYWVSALYKALVGSVVLDVKPVSSNTTKVYIYSHCTQTRMHSMDTLLNTKYERGDVTVFGVNTGSEPTSVSLKIGLETKGKVHIYSLTADNSEAVPKTLLNRQPLGLSHEQELPIVMPRVRKSTKSIILPARSIFFIVIPKANSRACILQDEPQKDKYPVFDTDDDDDIIDIDQISEPASEILEGDSIDSNQDVWYPKNEERNRIHTFTPPQTRAPEIPVRGSNLPAYVTYSKDSWLSSFPKQLKEVYGSQQSMDTHHHSSISGKKLKAAKMEKYKVLAQAILGKRDYNGVSYPMRENQNELPVQRVHNLTRFRRAMQEPQVEMTDAENYFTMINNQDTNFDDIEKRQSIHKDMYDIESEEICDRTRRDVDTSFNQPQPFATNEHINLLRELNMSKVNASKTQLEFTSQKPVSFEDNKNLELMPAIQKLILDSNDDDAQIVRTSRGVDLDSNSRRFYNSSHPISPFSFHKMKKSNPAKEDKAKFKHSRQVSEEAISTEGVIEMANTEVSSTPNTLTGTTFTFPVAVSTLTKSSNISTQPSSTSGPVTSPVILLIPSSNTANSPTQVHITNSSPVISRSHSTETIRTSERISTESEQEIKLYSDDTLSMARSVQGKAKQHLPKNKNTASARVIPLIHSTPLPKIKLRTKPTPVAKLSLKTATDILEIHKTKLKKILDDKIAKLRDLRKKLRTNAKSIILRSKRNTSMAEGSVMRLSVPSHKIPSKKHHRLVNIHDELHQAHGISSNSTKLRMWRYRRDLNDIFNLAKTAVENAASGANDFFTDIGNSITPYFDNSHDTKTRNLTKSRNKRDISTVESLITHISSRKKKMSNKFSDIKNKIRTPKHLYSLASIEAEIESETQGSLDELAKKLIENNVPEVQSGIAEIKIQGEEKRMELMKKLNHSNIPDIQTKMTEMNNQSEEKRTELFKKQTQNNVLDNEAIIGKIKTKAEQRRKTFEEKLNHHNRNRRDVSRHHLQFTTKDDLLLNINQTNKIHKFPSKAQKEYEPTVYDPHQSRQNADYIIRKVRSLNGNYDLFQVLPEAKLEEKSINSDIVDNEIEQNDQNKILTNDHFDYNRPKSHQIITENTSQINVHKEITTELGFFSPKNVDEEKDHLNRNNMTGRSFSKETNDNTWKLTEMNWTGTTQPTPNQSMCDSNNFISYLSCKCRVLFSYVYQVFTK